MIPGTYNFRPQYKGDTFKGIQFTLTKDVNGSSSPLDLTGASIAMTIKRSATEPLVKELKVGSGLTVTTPTTGVVAIDSFLVTFPAFKYIYAIRITFPDGTVNTYLTGTFEVKQNLL